MRVNPFISTFAEIGQYFRRSTTDKNQALSDFSIPGIVEDRITLSDKAIQKLSDTETPRVGVEKIAASSYYFIERRVPNIELLDGTASAFQVHNNLESLRKKKTSIPIVDRLTLKSSFLDKQVRSFLSINNKLLRLSRAAETLSKRESFNIKSAKSSDSDALTATTTAKSPVGNFQVNISQLASGSQLVSDQISDPFASLGASGAIQINGFEINIEQTDSLNDIKDKINFGEDSNQNGILDLGEDINNDGKLGVLKVPGTPFAKGVFIIEDTNGDNIIQQSEDLNNNELLDGGAAELEVIASIADNRLFLNSLSRNRKIILKDDNSVLLNIGFFELDTFNSPIIKEQQLDPDTFENLNKSIASSLLTVNGDSFGKEFNDISDIIPETTLNLKEASAKDISLSISVNLKAAIENIRNFVNILNDTIKFINKELAFSKVLEENVAAQKIRNGINDRTVDDVLNSDKKFNNLEKIGITNRNQAKNTFNQLAIKNLVTNFKKEVTEIMVTPPKGSFSIFGGLDKIGIRTVEDDTMVIDERKLKKVLEKNTDEVINLFADASSGIVAKLNDFIDVLSQPLSGAVALEVGQINSLIDSSFAIDLVINKANIQAAQFNRSAKEGIFLSITV